MNLKKYIKSFLLYEDMTMTDLAKLLSEKTGKEYSRQGLYHKLVRETLRYSEAKDIFDILGYDLKPVKKTK